MYTHDEREVADILAGIYSLPPEEIQIPGSDNISVHRNWPHTIPFLHP